MINKFKANFSEFSVEENRLVEMKNIPFKYSELLLDIGGNTYDNGLYSVHTFEDSIKWTKLISQYYDKDPNSFLSFGHDWMGIQYCVSRNTNEGIYLFDPSTHDEFYVDDNLFNFHDSVLSTSKIESLAADLFKEALEHLRIKSITYHECIGLKTPLFLNGKDELSNYDVYDIEVYWDFDNQLYQQIKDLPEGTKISNVIIPQNKSK
jgi:hypothetical protein